MGTDNSHFLEKIQIREEVVSLLQKKQIRVLELFAGKSALWNEIKKRHPEIAFTIFSIEKEKNKNPSALCADNRKVLPSLDLNQFDIIDVDDYGVPAFYIDHIAKRNYKGYVIITLCIVGMGNLPNLIKRANGFSDEFTKKCPTLFSQNSLVYIKNFLYLCEIKHIRGYFFTKKGYHFYFYYHN